MNVKKKYYLCLITGLSVLLTLANNFGLYEIRISNHREVIFGESFLEAIQSFCLAASALYLILYRKIFVNRYGKCSMYFRLLLLGFLLYEETSFLTKGLCTFCDSLNLQSEINFHNISLLHSTRIINIPLLDKISPIIMIYSSILLFLSWGGNFPCLNRLKGIFFEKEYSIFASLYVFEFSFSWLLSFIGLLSAKESIIHSEFIELIFYLSILFDLIDKIYKARLKY